MRCFVALRQWELQTPDLAGRMCGEGFGIRSGCLRVLAYIGMPKLNCSSGSSDACLAARVAPEECCCYRHTILWLKCVAVMFVRLIA